MRLVVQRVNKASVSAKGDKVGSISKGLLILVGIKKGDSPKEAELLAAKLSGLRVMADSQGKMNLSVKDINAEALVVSQFTLYADTSGGNRPSFINAALQEDARKIYDHFVAKLKELGLKLETGSFGNYMQIESILDGPVTIIIET